MLKDIRNTADKIPKGEKQKSPSASLDKSFPILLWDVGFMVVGTGNIKRY